MNTYVKIFGPMILISSILVGCSSTPGYQVTNQSKVSAKEVTQQKVNTENVQFAFTKANQHPEQKLKEVINSANKTLDIAAYSLTDKNIVNAIIEAKNRGVTVRIMSDKQESENQFQRLALKELQAAGIPVKINTHKGLMHLKVTIADSQIVTTGSFNYTKSAETTNDEVLVVIPDKNMATAWEQQYNAMWDDTANYHELNK
jgi:phosphatidylserine/phosphatidylglycerophosphate/cardiolipin synthase-like enzyme